MISLIAAMTPHRVIGKDNQLLWHISEDLKNFKELTTGNTIVMGRKTFESIGKALPNRNNIVLTRSMLLCEGIETANSVESALELAKSKNTDIFIIGGGEIYKQFLPLADHLHLSFIKKEYEGDAYFPEFNKDEWDVVEEKEFEEFSFRQYKKR